MKPNFKEIIAFLQNDPLAHIEIYDTEKGVIIEKALSAALATSKSGSVEQYFEGLYNSGVREITIVQKRKNGTSWKQKKCPYPYSLSRKQDTSQPTVKEPIPPQVMRSESQPMGLNGLAQQMGLSQAAMLSMYSNSEKLPEVTQERNELKAEVKKLKNDLDEERRKNLRYELGLESKASAGEKLMDTLSDPDVLTTVVSTVTDAIGKTRSAGLSQPQSQSNLPATQSDTKNALIQYIVNPKTTDDATISAYHVLHQIMSGNQAFADSLAELLKQHNLLKPA